MQPEGKERCRAILVVLLLFLAAPLHSQENVLERSVKLSGGTQRAGRTLAEVSKITGYIFTYDTRIIDPERAFALSPGEVPLRVILDSVTGDPAVKYSVIGRHIILFRVNEQPAADTVAEARPSFITVAGRITDAMTSEPLPYATVGIGNRAKGTVTNNNGDFILKISPGFLGDTLTVSYVGYINRRIPVKSLPGNIMTISMDRDYIPIPEVIIRAQDPLRIIRNTLATVAENYGSTPAMLTGFYREGVYRKKEPQVYSEAVVQIYKSAYARTLQNDQVRVVRSRKIENLETKDTLAVRLKAGLGSALNLDGVRHLYDFLDLQSAGSYEYHLNDIVTLDDHTAYVISFIQKPWVREALMKGEVYINADDWGLMAAEFELNPAYIDQVSETFVSRLPKGYTMKPEYVRYRVRYRQVGNRYYLSHVRGDLGFLAKGSKKLFNSHFTVFFELAVTDHRTENVSRFEHDETTPPYSVFSETITGYDAGFWKDFDFLKPEDDLLEALKQLDVRLGEAGN